MSNKKELKVYCKRINEETKKEETLWVVAKNVLVNGLTIDEHLNSLNSDIAKLETENRILKEEIKDIKDKFIIFLKKIGGLNEWKLLKRY